MMSNSLRHKPYGNHENIRVMNNQGIVLFKEFQRYLDEFNIVPYRNIIEVSPYLKQPPIPFLDSKEIFSVGIVPVYNEIVFCDMRFKSLCGLRNMFDPGYYYHFPKPFRVPFKP